MKICPKCRQPRPEEEFPQKYACNPCVAQRKRETYYDDPSLVKPYRKTNPEAWKKYLNNYMHDYIQDNPLHKIKYTIYKRIVYYLNKGFIKRPVCCQACGLEAKTKSYVSDAYASTYKMRTPFEEMVPHIKFICHKCLIEIRDNK